MGAVVGLTSALAISSVVACAIANAGSGHGSTPDVKVSTSPPAMNLATSPREKVNTSGIQGTLRPTAVDGSVEDAFQCNSTSSIAKVSCDLPSPEATPQVKAR